MREALKQLQTVACEWISTRDIPEIEWAKMRSLEFQETLQFKNTQVKALANKSCVLCKDFDAHVSELQAFGPIVTYAFVCST